MSPIQGPKRDARFHILITGITENKRGNTQRGSTERGHAHVILVRGFVTFGIHHLRALGGARCVPTPKAGDSLSSPAALGRTKPDGRMDANGAVRTRERGRERTDREGQRTERRLFREIRSTESERERARSTASGKSERASARRKAGPTKRWAGLLLVKGRKPRRRDLQTSLQAQVFSRDVMSN